MNRRGFLALLPALPAALKALATSPPTPPLLRRTTAVTFRANDPLVAELWSKRVLLDEAGVLERLRRRA